MSPSRAASLTLWMTGSIAVFVLVGSLAILIVFQAQADREERAAFMALAQANTAFLDRTSLPQSEQMAAQLGQVMGARVFFWHPSISAFVGKPGDQADQAMLSIPTDGQVYMLPAGDWIIGRVYRGDSRVFFLRAAPRNVLALNRPLTWVALLVFWFLSAALGLWLASRVTRPLKLLTNALPHLGTERSLPDVPDKRGDEIGQLARSLQQTHDTLNEEREKRRAAERLALLGQMATSLAHEVRNPVAAIRLHAQLLEGATDDEAVTSRAIIEDEAGRIESLVGQWMTYAKPAPPVLVETNLANLMRDAVASLEPQAAHVRVRMEVEMPTPGARTADDAVLVLADRHRLTQVLVNLLLNGIQAMPLGGVLRVQLDKAGPWARIIVQDQGTGFSPEALEKLGEPFFSEKEGGMGLGLAVSMEICRAHGGRFKALNMPEGGACVEFALPLRPSVISSPSRIEAAA